MGSTSYTVSNIRQQYQTMIKMIKVLFVICFVPSTLFGEMPKLKVDMEIVNNDNQSASVKCSWNVPGNVNLTWSVDGAPADAGTVTTDIDTSNSVISLVWDTLEKVDCDVTIVCKGEIAGSASAALRHIIVAGNESAECD